MVPHADALVGETITVPDMHTRKQIMNEKCDAFITLPGGLGTLEETVETITWSQLNIHAKPIVIFNYQGFYDSLRTWIQQASLQGFVPTSAANIPVFVDSVHDIFSSLLTYSVENKPFNYQWKKTYI
ncbi:hypothetical protein HMI54_000718 [Coelomomyces lativittatus]|nr:hypothetical protein HMI55_006643 [Coelomomyces lativittatus]KAJ1511579.1 hypothetical protein HMI54_000718 [Coelomomyces lativittatus]